MTSSFSWIFLFKSPPSSTFCFGDPTLAKLNQVKLLCETEFYITKYILICDPVVHTGTTFLLTSKTLPYKPKMYLQDKHSTTPSEVQSEETEEATPIHLTKVYKSLSHGTDDINWQMNAMLLTQVPCPITSTSYPGSKLLALLDHTFAKYLFLCLIDAHGKTPLCGSHQVPLDYGQTKHVWYTQKLIAADTTFSVPRSSSYTHQVSNCNSNLVTTPASSMDLTSKSVQYLSLPLLCRIFLILDKLKIEMNKEPFNHAAKNGEHSCVEIFHGDSLNPTSFVVPIRAYKRLNIFTILIFASFLLDLNIKSQRYIMHSATM